MFAEDAFYADCALKQSNKINDTKNRQPLKKQIPNIKQFLSTLDEQHNSQDQGIQDYKIGGYHPVHIGQVLLARYVVIQKLGWGHFSTVWLCKDFKYKTYVAVKIQKSSPNYMEAAFDQVQILQRIQKMTLSSQWQGKTREDTHVVGLLNAFIHKTVYGNHFCMVFQILRCNLLDVIKQYNYEGIPLIFCQQISRQVLLGLDYLHRVCGVIHTDLKPQNVMICLSNQQIKQIVENGQLNSKQLFTQRAKLLQQLLGVKAQNNIHHQKQQQSGEIELLNQKLKNPNITKNQKKNIKKKISKKLKQANKQATNNENKFKQSQNKGKQLDFSHLFDVKLGKIQINKKDTLKFPLKVKIADLGNACWKHHKFSSEIQTRQYRSPEVILGQAYNQTADIWSFACMMYQMLTGDLLFQPKKSQDYTQMQELLGPFDRNYIARSPKAKRYFNKNGKMKHFHQLNHYKLQTVLQLKNKIQQSEAKKFAQFLQPMLIPQQQKRVKAYQALKHHWLNIQQFADPCKMAQHQYEQLKQEFYQDQAKFQSIARKQLFLQASCQDNYQIEKTQPRNYNNKHQKFADIRFVDRSFTDLGYIGYCDGIDLEKLDYCKNWQFN